MRLHYYPGNANLAPHIVLEEMGLAHELALVDRRRGEHKDPEYLRLNPAGRIPTLVDGELVVFETAAIVLHLVDRYPAAGLAPAVTTPERARFYQWLMYLTNTVQAEAHAYFYPEQHTDVAAGVAAVKSRAEARWAEMFALLDAELGARGPYLLGAAYSALDPYLLMLVRWGRFMAAPPRTLPHLGRHAELVLARPATQRALAAEGLSPPFV